MGHIGGPTIGWFMFKGSVHSNTSGTCGDLLWTAVEGLECPNPLTKCMCLWENHLKWWEFSKKNIGHIPFFWGNIISSHCFWEVPRCSWNFHKRFSLPPSWQATFEGCGSAEKMGLDYFGRRLDRKIHMPHVDWITQSELVHVCGPVVDGAVTVEHGDRKKASTKASRAAAFFFSQPSFGGSKKWVSRKWDGFAATEVGYLTSVELITHHGWRRNDMIRISAFFQPPSLAGYILFHRGFPQSVKGFKAQVWSFSHPIPRHAQVFWKEDCILFMRDFCLKKRLPLEINALRTNSCFF